LASNDYWKSDNTTPLTGGGWIHKSSDGGFNVDPKQNNTFTTTGCKPLYLYKDNSGKWYGNIIFIDLSVLCIYDMDKPSKGFKVSKWQLFLLKLLVKRTHSILIPLEYPKDQIIEDKDDSSIYPSMMKTVYYTNPVYHNISLNYLIDCLKSAKIPFTNSIQIFHRNKTADYILDYLSKNESMINSFCIISFDKYFRYSCFQDRTISTIYDNTYNSNKGLALFDIKNAKDILLNKRIKTGGDT
jgi:hypothetical protein